MMCKTEKENLELRLTILRGNYEQVEKLLNASHEALASKDAEIATLKARCERMAKYIEGITGSCPLDSHDWGHPDDCGKVCNMRMPKKCWSMYFAEKTKDQSDE